MHFIRAFPLILVFVLVLGLTFAFADSSWYTGSAPAMLGSNPTYLFKDDTRYYYTSDPSAPAFLYYTTTDLNNAGSRVLYSIVPTEVYYIDPSNNITYHVDQPIYVDGQKYYYTITGPSASNINRLGIPVVISGSISESLQFINESSNVQRQNILFNVGLFIQGSLTWVTSTVSAVVSQPMLLFFVLIGFAGIFIGLLDRFRRFS